MYDIVSSILMYGDIEADSILMKMANIFKDYKLKKDSNEEIKRRILTEIKHLLIVATDYGFDKNLWHNYLTFFIIMNENPFSLTCEKIGANNGDVNFFAKSDFKAFLDLFNYDFSEIERELKTDVFTRISNYHSITKPELMYNKNVSLHVCSLSEELEKCKNEDEFFDAVTKFYKDYGVGMFGLNKAFRISSNPLVFQPINNMENVVLADLIGYEMQKKKLVENTKAFVEGKRANNVLLYGDSGTGKSTSVKAIVNEFYHLGLRMIEIYKHQFKDLSNIIAKIKNRNYRFIIYMDDLSFEEFEIEYKFLKAVIEGGVETKPENVLIYASSNRRHLIKENWTDRSDMNQSDVHRSETLEEKLSLVNRFGVQILYSKPNNFEYFDIVRGLAQRENLQISDEVLISEAHKWELSHGGISGRTAHQFISYLLSKRED